ncbi:MAG: glycosyltransferase [Ignavibacterium sp.]
MNLAPIALFVYNRLEHTKLAISSLIENEEAKESDLFIFSDGPKTEKNIPLVNEVRKFIKTINGFKSINIIEREKNIGLANSIITGISEVFNNYNKIIVLEDDLITSPYFLNFINKALDFYEKFPSVFAVSGFAPPIKINTNYNFDTYLIPTRSASWGWGTWKNIWKIIDWNIKDFDIFIKDSFLQKKFNYTGNDMTKMLIKQLKSEIDSWSIRFDYNVFKHNGYCVYPIKSFILNQGMNGNGTHFKIPLEIKVELNQVKKENFLFNIEPDDELINSFRKFHNEQLSFKNKLIRIVNYLLKKY